MLKRIILLTLGCAAVSVFFVLLLAPRKSENTSPPAQTTANTPELAATPVVTPLLNPLPGELTYLSFSESHSYFERVQYYEFFAENRTYTVHFWLAHEDEPYPVTVDQAWVDILTDIVQQNDMILWDGFSESFDGLLDGTSFHVELKFSDNTTVTASGYGSFPSGYGNATKALDKHFMQLLPEELRDW